MGFGEWCILMLLVQLFQAFGTMILVETGVEKHLLFTLSLSSVGVRRSERFCQDRLRDLLHDKI